MFNADTPIKSEKDDLLGRKNFSQQLAEAVLSYNQVDSFNIALFGEWGSGKTSVINMVHENIDKISSKQNPNDKPVVIRFNPWLFSDQTQLTIQFFKQLSSAFTVSKKIKSIGKAMDALGAAFEFTTPFIGSFGGKIANLTRGIGKKLANGTVSPDIQEIKNEIVKKLKKEKVKTIVIIDDIDRLSNQEIRSIFQLIKSIADFPNTIYLLAFDYDIVTRALGDVQNTDGSKYLEKIIQVPFYLPKINQEHLIHLFLNRLDSIINGPSNEKIDKKRWSILFYEGIKPYIKTIRDVIRFTNTFSLKYSFLENEVDVVDLIGITAIQVFEPELFSIIPFHKDSLCGSFSSYLSFGDSEIKSFSELFDSIVNGVNVIAKEQVTHIFSVLFPKVSTIKKKGLFHYCNEGYEAIRLGSINNCNFFDRYFSLSLEDSLSLQQAEHIIFQSNRQELLKLLFLLDSKQQINLFFNCLDSVMINHKKTNKFPERINILLSVIFENWDDFHDAEADQLFSYPWGWRLRNIASNLLWVFEDETARYSSIKSLFENTNIRLSVAIQILIPFEYEYNRYKANDDEKDRTPDEYTLTLDNI